MTDIETIVAIVKAMSPSADPSSDDNSHWPIGGNMMIRTVTHIVTGKIVKVTSSEIVVTDAAWIADTGRYAGAVASGDFGEVEPYPEGQQVIVGRGALIDATVIPKLPRVQK